MAKRKILLQGITQPIEGLNWESDTVLRIGRQDNVDIKLDHPSVSRLHAEILLTKKGWMVRDLGSTRGTFVNGVRVGDKHWELHMHDVLQCGNLALKVAGLEEDSIVIQPAADRPVQIKASGEFVVQVQATAKRSWETALESLAGEGDTQLQQGKHFLTLLRAGYHFCSVDSLDRMLQSILDDTVAVLDAQRGSIVLKDEKTGNLQTRAVSIPRPKMTGTKPFSRTLAERCFNLGESILCRDVNADSELQKATSVKTGTMTSLICALFRSPRKRLGVLHLDRGPTQPPFTTEDFYLADAIAANVSVAIETALLIEKQRDEFLHTLASLVRLTEVRVPYLAGHSQRVTAFALLLGEDLRLNPADMGQLRLAGELHDLGNIGVEDRILCKNGPLSPEELEQVKTHTVRGAAMLETVPSLAPLLVVVRGHHERWDGSGYPDALSGDQIPRLARILAVADAFDAMLLPRPYRPAFAVDDAFSELRKHAGKQFEPSLVEAFTHLKPRMDKLLTQVAPTT